MRKYVLQLVERYPELSSCHPEIEKAIEILITCYRNGNKLLLCGNGGSAADCSHIVGELMKGFLKKRPIEEKVKAEARKKCPDIPVDFFENLQQGLPAVNLCEAAALNTAFCNDVNPDYVFAQQVLALGKKGDVLIGISTSGNAKNVYYAMLLANSIGLHTIALTGDAGGALFGLAELCVKAPKTETYQVQELHLPIYHCLCASVEEEFFYS